MPLTIALLLILAAILIVLVESDRMTWLGAVVVGVAIVALLAWLGVIKL